MPTMDSQRNVIPKAWKPPSRLQKQAPPILQLDLVPIPASTNPFSTSNEANDKAIPLLSPLILSPEPFLEATERRASESGNEQIGGDDEKDVIDTTPNSPPEGRKQPVVSNAFPDASSLFTFFQSQCMIVNHAQ